MKLSFATFLILCMLVGCTAPANSQEEPANSQEEPANSQEEPANSQEEPANRITYTFENGEALVFESSNWSWVDGSLAPHTGPGIHFTHFAPTGEVKCEAWWSIRLDGSLIAMKRQCTDSWVWAASPTHRLPGLLPTWDSVQDATDQVSMVGTYVGPLFATDGTVAGNIMLSPSGDPDEIRFRYAGGELPSEILFDERVATREGNMVIPRIDSPMPPRPAKYSSIWYESAEPIYDMPVSPHDMVEATKDEAPEVYEALQARCAAGGELTRFSVVGTGGIITNEGARMKTELSDGQVARVIWSRMSSDPGGVRVSDFGMYQVNDVEPATEVCRPASPGMNHSEAAKLQQRIPTGGTGGYSLAIEDYGTECASCLSDLLLWRLGQAEGEGEGVMQLFAVWADGRSGQVLAMSITPGAYESMAMR